MTRPGGDAADDELRALLADQSFDGLALSVDGRVIACNGAFCTMVGVCREAAIGMTAADLTTPEGLEVVMESIRSGSEAPYVVDARRADGSYFKCEIRGRSIEHRGRTLRVTSFRDMTQAIEAERALSRYRHFFDHSSVGFGISTGDEPVFELVNPALASMHGYEPEELIGQPVALLKADRDVLPTLIGQAHRDGSVVMEDESRRKDGSTFAVRLNITAVRDGSGGVAYRSATVEDITERKQREEERKALETKMREAQRLESIGLLAGGIAHDFNNLLVGVLSHADLARHTLPASSPAIQHVRQIEAAARRAAELTHQLLAYAGRAQPERRTVDISALVRSMLQLLEVSVPASVRLVDQTASGATPVDADETQLRQVVMNFVTNAADSEGSEGGDVIVRTGLVDIDEATARAAHWHGTLEPGPYVQLEVVDSGCGMDGPTRERMFDPFFSTKEHGRGLGLAAVLGILHTHDAAVRVESTQGVGTAVTVAFPLSERAVERPSAPGARDDAWTGTGTALVVDDVPHVRSAFAAVLTSLGFDVLVAADGRQGIELFETHRQHISVVLLDATMPGLSGRATLEELLARGCEVPVILTSGHTNESFSDIASVAAFLPKPFDYDTLANCLKNVLG